MGNSNNIRDTVRNKFLESLINYERIASSHYDFKLDKFRRFLHAVGNPHKQLSNVIIIAGTKGKGSTASFIESGLRGCGINTGLYTSPHVLSLRERIKFNGEEISQNDLDRLVNQIKENVRKYSITFFEAVTAIAFLYFIEKKVDYTILEVGLGGRLDATNVAYPKVSVITKIGYDHTEILGNTLSKIAKEKAGIIHPGSYVVLSRQKSSAHKVIVKKIKETGNEYCDVAKEFKIKDIKITLKGSEFMVNDSHGLVGKYKINLLGKHQIENACTALACLRHLKAQDFKITDNGVKNGLKKTQILARCQIVSRKPLIIVDSAHNPDSAKALCEALKTVTKQKVVIILGSSQGKLVNKIFGILSPLAKQFILTQSENPRRIPVLELVRKLKPFKVPYYLTPSVKEAVNHAMISSKKTPLVFTGSFYVAGEALYVLKKLSS